LSEKNALLGKIFKISYAVLLLAYAFPFLLDLEKFSLTAFSDTEPTFFSFLPFFIFCGFACVKGIKAVGRSADLCPVLFFLPFLGLIVLSVSSTNFSAILPVFEFSLKTHLKTAYQTAPFWCGGALALPMFEGYEPRTGDEKKLALGYLTGAVCALIFLAIFYGLYGPLTEKEHYALSKIGQFFPALATLGRTDLLLVYAITVALLFFTVLPVLLSSGLFVSAFGEKGKLPVAIAINALLFVAVLFLNRRYNAVYRLFTVTLAPVYIAFGLALPPSFLIFSGKKGEKKNEK
jgi:hypothetical protein